MKTNDQNTRPVRSLEIGLSEDQRGYFDKLLPAGAMRPALPYDLEKLMEPMEAPPSVILCADPPEGISIEEIAQLLRIQYRDASIYMVAGAGSKYTRQDLMKNGFTDVFFLPLERDFMHQTITSLLARLRQSGIQLRPVKVLDLGPETVLEFDTYIHLPMNDRSIKFSSAGYPIPKERLDRLQTHNVSSLLVAEDDMSKFYSYTADRLKQAGQDSHLSETQRADLAHRSVRQLISSLFSDDATSTDCGKRVVSECQKIVRSYITDGNSGSWYNRILATLGGRSDTYSHATNVSTYAAMFAIALGLESVEDIAMAGLLHDIGLSKIPEEVQNKSERTREEEELYRNHPEYAVQIIQERKLVVSALVHKIIRQSHEHFDGTGFPKGLSGNRFCVEAQVLAFSDRFDELTAGPLGKTWLNPLEVVQKLQVEMVANPGRALIGPQLLQRICSLFPPPP